jgi:hypothetical protein
MEMSNDKTQMFPNSPEIPGRGGTRKQIKSKWFNVKAFLFGLWILTFTLLDIHVAKV